MSANPPLQLSLAELRNMSPEAVSKALHDGQFAELFAGRDPGRGETGGADQGARGSPESLLAQLKTMPFEEVVLRHRAGDFDELLGRK